jgi:8-oxo-dGTP diphosphatase
MGAVLVEVTAAVIFQGGRVLIAKRRKDDRQGGKWEFPGGKIRPGETPESCLRRELFEELGIEARIGEPVGTWEHRYDHGSIRLLVYRVPEFSGTARAFSHEEIRWVRPEELRSCDFSEADRPVAKIISGEGNTPPGMDPP